MTDIIIRNELDIAIEINAIKRMAAQTMLSSAIEIGGLLCEAKQKVAHGEWGAWLKDNVAYSVSNAENLMRIYREREDLAALNVFGNDMNPLEGLSVSQAVALLGVPKENRAEFVEKNDVPNMSVRELNEAIKKQKEAEARAAQAEQLIQDSQKQAQEATAYAKKAQERVDELESEVQSSTAEIAELEAKLAEAEKAGGKISPADKKKLEAEIAEKYKKKNEQALEEEKSRSAGALKLATEEFEKKSAEIAAEAKKNAEAESAARIAELEADLKKSLVAASPYLATFQVHLDNLKAAYQGLLGVIAKADEAGDPVAEKLRAVLGTIKSNLEA